MKRSIQRLRLERAFIFEKLEEHTPSAGDDSDASDSSLSLKREKDSFHSETHDASLSHSSVRDTASSFALPHTAPSNTTSGTRRRRATRDPDAPKRPSNPFLKFCDVERERIRSENEGIDGFDITRALGIAWQNLDDESRKPYYDAYELEKKRLKIKVDQYENENFRSSNQQLKSKLTDEPSVQKHSKNIEKSDTKSAGSVQEANNEMSLDINYNQESLINHPTQLPLPAEITLTPETFNDNSS